MIESTVDPNLADGFNEFIHTMPKAEIHVHLEGAIQPETLLELARRHDRLDVLPSTDLDVLRQWFQFTDFPHFIRIYLTISELLRTPDAVKARKIAGHLDQLNSDRQRAEESILNEIEERVKAHPETGERYSLVFAGDGWHRGVIGIVAQRVVERHYRPTLVIGVEDGVGQGSGRSIANFHLLNALTDCESVFERFGGHAAAAGFTLERDRIDELTERFEAYARRTLQPQDLVPLLRVDAEVDLDQMDWPVYEQLKRMEPFGMGNPTPVFVARGLRLAAPGGG